MLNKKLTAVIMAAIIAASFAACTGAPAQDESGTSAVTTSTDTSSKSEESTNSVSAEDMNSDKDADAVYATANTTSNGKIDATDLFTDRDLKQTADLSEAETITLSDGKTETITKEGVYVISGSAQNAEIIVEVEDNEKVQLVLDGVSVTNASTPFIYVKNADKVFVTTTEGSDNTISVTSSFTADGDTNTDAAIFSKDDLVLNGLGKLTISSTDNGISCKDDLKITGGTYDITCASDAIEANDSIAVCGGDITISSQKDGLHSENDEDNSVGYIYICGGTFNINASSDGIQGTTVVQIDDGTFDITASEGIEGTYVQLNGGTINISASDDGINASNKSSAYPVTIEINGGDITVTMGAGDTDGIDSNGDLYINGGTVNVTGQSPFDYDGTAQHNGGTLIVNGSETDEITNQFMGGGMGGMRGGNMGGAPGGDMGGMPNGGMGGF